MALASLMRELNLTDREIRRRLDIVGFGPADLKGVLAVSDVVVKHAQEHATLFFDYLRSLGGPSALLSVPETMEIARRLKTDHLRAMAGGVYGARYVEERLELGMLYAGAGLDPLLFLGAYHRLIAAIGLRIIEESGDSPLKGFDHFLSLRKISTFDLSLMMDVIVVERERVIRRQQEAIRELSTPVLRVREGLLVLPIIGAVDTQRARQLTDALLDAVRAHRAQVVVMDITGVPVADATIANHLVQTVRAARLIGAETVITRVSAEVAEALVMLGVQVGALNTAVDLQGGLELVERALVYRVTQGQGALRSTPS
jgi:rsbT co-antagonist protein RsbR